jgi:glycosyltransferase involved in cell wall biosynthesis
MKFLIVTHVIHKKKDAYFAYEPYVREMNLWTKNFTKTRIIAPLVSEEISSIETCYKNSRTIIFSRIPSFNILTYKNKLLSLFKIPFICYKIFSGMIWADHIHLRCPGNIGLLGTIVQIFFPCKIKTVKYAGNWDPNSKQPRAYRIQKWILGNTFLTRNCKVLVYGEWVNQTKNIVPFFTASYFKKEIVDVNKTSFENSINLIFVGSFSKGKQPLKTVKVAHNLIKKNYNIKLNMYGDGEEMQSVKDYIIKFNLKDEVIIHGNQSKEIIKKAFQASHFLVFISKSEGWPKVVAEAMFWSCLPLSTNVSCVSYMLGNGDRGSVINENEEEITNTVIYYIQHRELYLQKQEKASKWSQKYTLDYFENEIKNLVCKN